jgi:uncharacterized protein (DUF2141 family)
VGTISGGPKDQKAPRIVSCNPEDGQRNVNADVIFIEFDEFINLQKPNENIILLPSNVEYDYLLKGKELQINFKEKLKENTTYSLYLNEAIKDITEGNDSLIQIAFSTGIEIDENEAYFHVFDGFSGDVQKEVLVALYDSLNQIQPTYFSNTDPAGYSKLRALKEGSFFYAAFIDENKNRIRDGEEFQFASDIPIIIDSAYTDTLELYITKPEMRVQGIEASFINPYLLEVMKPNDRSFDQLIMDSIIDSSNYRTIEENIRRYSFKYYYQSIDLQIDTLNKKVRNDDDIQELTLIKPLKKLELLPGKCCFQIDFEAPIDSLSGKTRAFRLMNLEDSLVITLNTPDFQSNKIDFNLDSFVFSKALLTIDSASVYAYNSVCNDRIEVVIQRKKDEDLGVLNLKVSTDMDSWFVELMQKGESVSVIYGLDSSETLLFDQLSPGSYTLNIVGDENKNDKWDPFDPILFIGPEKRFEYGKPIKIKANWEHEIDFVINP